MSDSFGIAGIRLYQRPIPLPRGALLAHFTVEIGPILIEGARLVALPEGECRVMFPFDGRLGRVAIKNRRFYANLLAAVLAAYRALGGVLPADLPLADGASAEDHLHDDSRNPGTA